MNSLIVVLSAAGSSFCSGVDLADMQAVREQRGSFDYELLPEVFKRLAAHRNPTVATVQGPAVAGGCELALHCDIRIGSPSTKFIMPLVKLGLGLPCEAAERLVDMAGKTAAADYVYVMDFDGDKIRHMTKIWNDGMTMRELGWA